MPGISWLLEPFITAAAFIASFFVAEDSANFGIVQMAVTVLLMTSIVAIITFLPAIMSWTRARSR